MVSAITAAAAPLCAARTVVVESRLVKKLVKPLGTTESYAAISAIPLVAAGATSANSVGCVTDSSIVRPRAVCTDGTFTLPKPHQPRITHYL